MLYILEAIGAIELTKVLMNVFCEYLRGVKLCFFNDISNTINVENKVFCQQYFYY